jgi:predicted TIM-barrel fold metal-dependent hydrolase
MIPHDAPITFIFRFEAHNILNLSSHIDIFVAVRFVLDHDGAQKLLATGTCGATPEDHCGRDENGQMHQTIIC